MPGGAVPPSMPHASGEPGAAGVRPVGLPPAGRVSRSSAVRRIASTTAVLASRIVDGLSPMAWLPQGPAILRPLDVLGDDSAARI